jgi:adenylate cyclase
VLACERACAALFAAPEWRGLLPWRTRYGVHRAEVLVGHFGAPDRLSYTALGDGVNLASRLEGLNKLYGTRLLVTQAVVDSTGDRYVFRRLDRVAVKGKSHAVDVFELLGEPGDASLPRARARAYEHAFAAYLARDFAGALVLLETQLDDAPSRLLEARCRHLVAAPPSDDWNGVYTAKEK